MTIIINRYKNFIIIIINSTFVKYITGLILYILSTSIIRSGTKMFTRTFNITRAILKFPPVFNFRFSLCGILLAFDFYIHKVNEEISNFSKYNLFISEKMLIIAFVITGSQSIPFVILFIDHCNLISVFTFNLVHLSLILSVYRLIQ